MKTTSISISVVMASYNGAAFIEEQLHSIINQTLPPFEIIVVDDVSIDTTFDILQKIAAQNTTVKVYRNEINLGINASFQNAIAYATGNWIAFADQDDVWELNKLEILANYIGAEDVVFADSLLVDAENKSLDIKFSSLLNMKSYNSGAPFLMNNCVPGHAMLVNAQFLKSILPFPQEFIYDKWINYAAASNNGIVFVNELLVRYRQHSNNSIGTHKSNNKKEKKDPFISKRNELLAMQRMTFKDEQAPLLLAKMIQYFHKGFSIGRSKFFFQNRKALLAIKKKSDFRKWLYCLKMALKPNY